jgi:hypothetical protein
MTRLNNGAETSRSETDRRSTQSERRIVAWSAGALFVLGLAYVPTLVIGFVVPGNWRDPLQDPFLAILEALILLMVPFLVMLMAALHAAAPSSARAFSLGALAFMTLTAGTTGIVHVVALTVGRQLGPARLSGYARILSWEWPSVLYALDIVAWDLFLGLALLFAAPMFRRGGLEHAIRWGLTGGGVLCLAGLAGPALGELSLRWIGVVGYAVVFPVCCLLLAVLFHRPPPSVEGAV